MLRFRLAKAFFAWKDRFGEVDKNFAMRRKLQATISKGRMRRAFLGWRKVQLIFQASSAALQSFHWCSRHVSGPHDAG